MAKKFLLLSEDAPNLYEDGCPSTRFPSKENAAESNYGDYYIIINRVWANSCYNSNLPEIDYILFHELRHMHQQAAIERYIQNGYTGNDTENDIGLWMQDYSDYKRNTGNNESRERNAIQSIERDACAYGVILTNFLYANSPMQINLRLPEATSEDIQRYMNEKPEIVRAIERLNQGLRI